MQLLLQAFRSSWQGLVGSKDNDVSSDAIPITSLQQSCRRNSNKIAANILDQQVFFETSDVNLAPSLEAFGTAFLIATTLQNRKLQFTEPLAEDWLENAHRAVAFAKSWWDNDSTPLVDCKAFPSLPRCQPSTGLFFSCGVDSFHSLLCYPAPIDYVIGVVGFDVRLSDRMRHKDLTQQVRAISEQLSLSPIIVRTNLRRHPFFRKTPWEKTHGSALASVGHLLTGTIGKAVVSSGGTPDATVPDGSDLNITPYFGSNSLRVEHFGSQYNRFEKLCQIAPQPIVQEHLRVCWEHQNSHKNCGRCEKCLRTMVALETIGYLDHFQSFGFRNRIAESLNRLCRIPPCQHSHYQQVLEAHPSTEIKSAIKKLLERSPRE